MCVSLSKPIVRRAARTELSLSGRLDPRSPGNTNASVPRLSASGRSSRSNATVLGANAGARALDADLQHHLEGVSPMARSEPARSAFALSCASSVRPGLSKAGVKVDFAPAGLPNLSRPLENQRLDLQRITHDHPSPVLANRTHKVRQLEAAVVASNLRRCRSPRPVCEGEDLFFRRARTRRTSN